MRDLFSSRGSAVFVATLGLRFLIVMAMLSALTPAVFAQAWVLPKGRGLVSFGYQNQSLGTQLTNGGIELESGDVSGDIGTLGFDYSFTNRLAMSVGAAYVSAKFEGGSGDHGTTIDDGSSHGTWQDSSIVLRFVALKGPVTLTPFVGFGTPITDYEALGMAAPGRNLDQIPVGIALGWIPRPATPDFFLQVRYTYSFVESLQGIDTDRWLADTEIGYAFAQHFVVGLFGSYQESVGGVDLLEVFSGSMPTVIPIHDQVVALDEWRAGFRFSYLINDRFEISANYSETLSGRNLQENSSIGLSFGWNFGTGAATQLKKSGTGTVKVASSATSSVP